MATLPVTAASPPPPRVWLTIAHYCVLYDVDRKTVWKYVDAGLLSYWQVGRIIRIANVPPHDPENTNVP